MAMQDKDPQETNEWLEALANVIEHDGPERAHFIVESLIEKTRMAGGFIPHSPHTAYINTIPPDQEKASPGDHALEWKIRSLIRWNAMAMVVRANKSGSGIGGHIASFASAATLYEVGFNHFWRAPSENDGGDLLYIQGHCAPGVYSRSYLEGRISEDQLVNFRSETGNAGLSSYPHPWLMPDYWQFATVSMGLGPIQAIYQARLMKYMENRGLIPPNSRKVWCFCGDGEMDEPESLGAIDIAAREKLDNLIFVVNCNLQRLDGPVRGDGKIIQELEGIFRGAGWKVLKVIWGGLWDSLLEHDRDGHLKKVMMDTLDGEYQSIKAQGDNIGSYVRETFFAKHPEVAKMVSKYSDEDLARLNRGGHDPHKVYAAYHRAVNNPDGKPTVILAKTIKGYGMGEAGEGQNITHQQKKMGLDALKSFRDRFKIPVSDEDIEDAPFYKPAEDSPEMQYLHERRKALGGYLPQRSPVTAPLKIPALESLQALLDGSGDREISTTMAFVRILGSLVRDKNIGERIVPIVPDEARTFGMEGMFRQLGIYSIVGQLYEPQDRDQMAWYREDVKGQVLEEGINEAGAMSSWLAAATAYANHQSPLIPFYIFYSMFGFQRIGDLAWAAGDMRARGFLLGGTAGRTTLNGEGLQHEDGHSHIIANTVPNCLAYDPSYGYELAVIIQHGMQRMYVEQEDVYYYLTVENENYKQPAMPKGVEEGIKKGLYPLSQQADATVQILGCGSILRECEKAAELLKQDWQITANLWSATSFSELRRDGLACDRQKLLNPKSEATTSYVEQCFADAKGIAVTATDYMKSYGDMIRPFMPLPYYVLGTDGFGRSDSREELRNFFEVDARWITVTALRGLADNGEIEWSTVEAAIEKYGLDTGKPNPVEV